MKQKETATAVLFLCALAAGLILLASSFFGQEGALEAAVRDLVRDPSTLGSFLTSAEGKINQDLDRSHLFIQLYGGAQRAAGRQVVVDMADPDYTVVRMDDGSLAFQNLTTEPREQADHARSIVFLRDYLTEHGDVPFLYVQAPQKIEASALPAGMENYGNENADQLLAELARLGVDTLDLRPALRQAAARPDVPLLYFRTDHHWTPEGAFLGYQTLSADLAEQYGLSADPQYTDKDSYEIITYEDAFLGSQGKRVGTLYGGVDSIELWKPRFGTSFTYSAPGWFSDRTGTFEQSLLFPERVSGVDYFGGNPYTLYSGGDYGLARMINHLNPQGPRVLLFRDSFACALAPFLALQCGELITIDLRHVQGDLGEQIDALAPDLVIAMYTASSTRLDDMCSFDQYLEK